MGLKSALEDFEGTTLRALPGLLARLHYIAGLHDGHGKYSHWGMERTHGEGPACRAIQTAHATVLAQVLRTPLRVLDTDLQNSAGGRLTAREFLASLVALIPRVLPARMGVPSQKHLTAVLDALSALLASQAHASRPDA